MISVDVTKYDLLFRELSAGVWFVLCCAITWVLIAYIIRERRMGYRYDPVLLAAIFLLLYFIGTAVRIGSSWGGVVAIRTGKELEPYISTPWYTAALVLSIIGLVGMIWLFSRDGRRVMVATISVVAAVVIPLLVLTLV